MRTVIEVALLVIAALLLLMMAGVLVRLTTVRLAWRRIRRRLCTPGADGVVGAWMWARLHLAVCRAPLPAQLSPDLAVRDRALDDLLPSIADPLRELAALVIPAAFAAHDETSDHEHAWMLADQVRLGSTLSLTRARRTRLSFVKPPAIAVAHHGPRPSVVR